MVLGLLNLTRREVLATLGMSGLTETFFFEVIDMIIMSLAIGYIFSGFIKKPRGANYDPIIGFKKDTWEDVKFGAIVAGLAVVFHELSHKFVAMAFGAKAVLYAPYGFYIFVIILKAIGFPLLFFVGGFVEHTGLLPLQAALVALAGPLMNFVLWGATTYALKKNKIKRKYVMYAVPFAKINLFLGIFNMIPIPPFDGGNFIVNLFRGLF